MPSEAASPTPGTLMVLEAIADGYTYDRILSMHPNLTYLDIFAAAREALRILTANPNATQTQRAAKAVGKSLSEYRKTDPRAYEKWTQEEENALIQLMDMGHTVRHAAELLQRKPSALQSRLEKINSLRTDVSAEGNGVPDAEK
jgi:DNA repair ATPase RecN